MATTQTTKRRTAATKRSTTAKKAAATRARNSAAGDLRRAETTAKRRVNTARNTNGRSLPLVAEAERVGAVAANIAQTGVTGGFKLVASAARTLRNAL